MRLLISEFHRASAISLPPSLEVLALALYSLCLPNEVILRFVSGGSLLIRSTTNLSKDFLYKLDQLCRFDSVRRCSLEHNGLSFWKRSELSGGGGP